MTVVYFEKKKKIKLDDAELRIFVNMWDRTIIASDIFLMAGCIMQFLLTLVVRKLSCISVNEIVLLELETH